MFLFFVWSETYDFGDGQIVLRLSYKNAQEMHSKWTDDCYNYRILLYMELCSIIDFERVDMLRDMV